MKVCQHSLGAVIKMKLHAVGCLSWVADQRKAAWWDSELSNITKLVFTSGFSFLFALFFSYVFQARHCVKKMLPHAQSWQCVNLRKIQVLVNLHLCDNSASGARESVGTDRAGAQD